MGDNYKEAIIQRLDKQLNKGIAKYGQSLEKHDANLTDRLDHLSDELVDGLHYIEWIKDYIKNKPKNIWLGPDENGCLWFPKLNLKYDSILAQALQLTEETGELAEKIGLLTGTTGKRKEVPNDIIEQAIEEVMDVAQAACGIIHAISNMYPGLVDIQTIQRKHIKKMRERQYLL